MQKKVERISNRLAELVSGWDGIEAIVLGEAAEIAVLDPYFNINLDVYHNGSMLPANDRKDQLGNPLAFDSALVYPEDRFLEEELPVRIRYQETVRFDLLLKRIDEQLWVFHESGTYPFYRIKHGQVLHQKSKWLDESKKKLSSLGDHFWNVIREATKSAISYHLNDVHAAVYRNDNLFYLLALSGFLRNVCSFLCALNEVFEPSGRMLYEKIKTLGKVPEEFNGRFESLLRDDPELPPGRKREIAALLAKSIMSIR